MAYVERELYCLNCGKPFPVWRKVGNLHATGHRKKLYCPYCKTVVNHIEIRTWEERNEFLTAFANGDFVQEALESIEECKND